jgi:uncharacterized membrane protein YphA (DoxX/SURF4 family)
MLVAGWVLTALPAGLLIFSGIMKFGTSKELNEGFAHLGLPTTLAWPLGILELSCVLLYLLPRTAVLGAILLAGYLGGAIITHVRIGEPFFMQAILGVILWLGLYLREPRLRALIPWRTTP